MTGPRHGRDERASRKTVAVRSLGELARDQLSSAACEPVMADIWRVGLGVKAVIRRRDRVLILRRSARSPQYPGQWDLPGGAVEKGESLEHALLREVKEETGLSPKIETVYHAYLADWPASPGETIPCVGLMYLCTSKSKREPRLRPAEHSECAWVQRADLSKYPTRGVWAEPLRLAFAIPVWGSRATDGTPAIGTRASVRPRVPYHPPARSMRGPR
jgi:8-oxo-dGTP diphosphatase